LKPVPAEKDLVGIVTECRIGGSPAGLVDQCRIEIDRRGHARILQYARHRIGEARVAIVKSDGNAQSLCSCVFQQRIERFDSGVPLQPLHLRTELRLGDRPR
jgi:hypothetical protein